MLHSFRRNRASIPYSGSADEFEKEFHQALREPTKILIVRSTENASNFALYTSYLRRLRGLGLGRPHDALRPFQELRDTQTPGKVSVEGYMMYVGSEVLETMRPDKALMEKASEMAMNPPKSRLPQSLGFILMGGYSNGVAYSLEAAKELKNPAKVSSAISATNRIAGISRAAFTANFREVDAHGVFEPREDGGVVLMAGMAELRSINQSTAPCPAIGTEYADFTRKIIALAVASDLIG